LGIKWNRDHALKIGGHINAKCYFTNCDTATVGDPFKDTSSVSLNPVIKFTTLFGLLAVEIAVTMTNVGLKLGLAACFFIIALIFVYRSFYSMRISEEKLDD
jgi:K(+)-stimulated pyrophosphate-energized sodium pump